MGKIISISLIILFCSCNSVLHILFKKKLSIKSNEEVLNFYNNKKIYYDYLIRPSSKSSYNKLKVLSNRSNGIVFIDSLGNMLLSENDTMCHKVVRSLILNKNVEKHSNINFKKLLEENTICCSNNSNPNLFENKLKNKILIFGYATFIPINNKTSDFNFINELKKDDLLKNITIVILDYSMITN